ncbi:MAG TPA: type IV pilus secretin PilQ [Nitrospirota bacterium]|nr:type IV pilus secretin PilQ [Nitrospirota bacterium]
MAVIPSLGHGRIFMLTFLLLLLGLSNVHANTIDVTGATLPFSMEFRDADIKDVLRAVGQAANLNIIISDSVTGQVTMSLKDVDLWAALESILKTKGLTYVRDANMVRVLSVAEARDIDMETRVFPLGHARSQDILPIVEKVKSDKARISVDSRMNAIVVRDLSLNIDQMARLLQNLDVNIPEVLIEAEIVEVSTSYARDLGVQWGGKYASRNTVVTGGATGVNSSATAGTTGGSSASIGSSILYPITGDIGLSGNAYAVNLPASVGTGAGGAIGMSFGKIAGNVLDLQLSAMQTTGNGKILSNPKVRTINGKEAKISSGTDIPVRIVSATAQTGGGSTNTVGVQTISASLALSATPNITNDNKISMAIKVEKSEPDFSNEVDGIPTITKRDAVAEVVVNNGETIVLGGIITKNEAVTESAVPFLSNIPILGWLFKNKGTSKTEDELMIFITPTIVKD